MALNWLRSFHRLPGIIIGNGPSSGLGDAATIEAVYDGASPVGTKNGSVIIDQDGTASTAFSMMIGGVRTYFAAIGGGMTGTFDGVVGGTTPAAGTFTTLSANGTAAFNGHVTLGNAAGDDITVTGSLASSIAVKTTNVYDLGATGARFKDGWFTGTVTATGGFAGPHNGTVGAGTPAAGAFTTGNFSGLITASGGVAGALNGVLGGVTPAAATVTTLSASSTANVTGILTIGSRFVHNVQTVDMADATHSLVLGTAGAAETQLLSDLVLVDANSSGTEDLRLPPTASSAGLVLFIMNVGGESFAIKTSDGGTTVVAAVASGKGAVVACNGAGWGNILGS